MENEQTNQIATQLTQGTLDPRRLGGNHSGLAEHDVADVMCILHPCSPSAFQVVAATAQKSMQHILQSNGAEKKLQNFSQSFLEEQETFIIGPEGSSFAMDLAFRFSATPINPGLGFVFGRHAGRCDIVLINDTHKRVSNIHFRIFINESGVLMLQDMSTNGTMVDDVLLRGKTVNVPQKRMLNPGSIIQILSPQSEEIIKFIVRVPSRDGHLEAYDRNFQEYMQRMRRLALRTKDSDAIARRLTPANPTEAAVTRSVKLLHHQYGMHWGGGDKYNVVGMIGKGAFATVYQLATKAEGMLFAAKELEKRKFMKNGVLDHKLDNEMQIMKAISHPNIVKYVDYQDHANHLYIIMEFVPFGDLQHYLTTHGPLTEALGKLMSAQVFDSLAYLHGKRITHRDIKPDNILLADVTQDSFVIKLSDFGLSKVVKDNETFLKTFCGTLLYCAPEVFPHYDAHVAGRGQKRHRRGLGQVPKFHSYSQSVDIWSYAAVLWYSLCLKPPFEGVADNTGRGMFDKIMMTPLDSTNLIEKDISDDAVALLAEMLNTDPALRPSPTECLQHPWLASVSHHLYSDGTEGGLRSIVEETENEPESRFAGLSIAEYAQNDEQQEWPYDDEVSVHSNSFDFFDPRQSKRFKSGAYAYRSHADFIDSSPELAHGVNSDPALKEIEDTTADPAPKPKLFGEISESQFKAMNVQHEKAESRASVRDEVRTDQVPGNDVSNAGEDPSASPSLLGAESLLRDVHMSSSERSLASSNPGSNISESADPPVPPSQAGSGLPTSATGAHDDVSKAQQRNTFDRRISIPFRASFFYDPNNPKTHTLEYASRVSGHDFRANPEVTILRDGLTLLATTKPLVSGSSNPVTQSEHVPELGEGIENTSRPSSEGFIRPPPRLGRLISTDDSFASITINLTEKVTTWGRLPNNTHVYSDSHDTRIPKRGIILYFQGPDMHKIPDSADLAKVSGLQAILLTESRTGLQVNGVSLGPGDVETKQYGMLYTGDEITVYSPGHRSGSKGLRFRCEFFHGESQRERPREVGRFRVETTKSPALTSAVDSINQ